MKTRTFFINVVTFLILFLALSSNSIAVPWELGFKTKDAQGNYKSFTVTVYTYNSLSKDLEYATGGSTHGSPGGYADPSLNGASDINSNDTQNAIMGSLPGGVEYYIRIDNQYCIITYSGSNAYGDITFSYQEGSSIGYQSTLTCGYEISGPYPWLPKTITLANDLGNDKTSCYGIIHFNSITMPNIGIGGTSLTREARTFPHTIAGEDLQYVNNYNRKWRKWSEDGLTDISRPLSQPQPYSFTAKYAKQVTATINKNYSGGYVTVNSTVADQTAYMYDDLQNSVYSSPHSYTDGLYYELSYWVYNGSNNYNNPLLINNPASNVSITANFTRRPDNAGKNVHFSNTVGTPIIVYWTDNVNNNVTYNIYRKVYKNGVWGTETLLATVNKGVQHFQDPDYLLANYRQYDLINYDVREYFTIDMTYSYADWCPVYGQLYSICQNNNMAAEISVEKPTESGISNHPNPFNPATTINYQLKENGPVTIRVFDILGKEIVTLVDESKSAGYYKVDFDASKLTSGVYICTIHTNNFFQSKKLLLVK